MNNDWICRAVWIFRTRQSAHRETLTRVAQAALETCFGMSNTLNCSAQTSKVHEGEHAVQTTVFWANKITNSAIKVHHTGGGCLDAHFVLDRATGYWVTLAQ